MKVYLSFSLTSGIKVPEEVRKAIQDEILSDENPLNPDFILDEEPTDKRFLHLVGIEKNNAIARDFFVKLKDMDVLVAVIDGHSSGNGAAIGIANVLGKPALGLIPHGLTDISPIINNDIFLTRRTYRTSEEAAGYVREFLQDIRGKEGVKRNVERE